MACSCSYVPGLYLICRHDPLLIAAVAGSPLCSTESPSSPLLGDILGRGYMLAGRRLICLCGPVVLGFAGPLYCDWAFDDALAPLRNRMDFWAMRPPLSLGAKLVALLTLRPAWEVFVPGSPAFWGNFTAPDQALFALYPANSLYFLGALGLCGLGAWRGWLNRAELLFSLGILLIPYWYTGYEASMTGMAATIRVRPLYLVPRCSPIRPGRCGELTGLAVFFQAVRGVSAWATGLLDGLHSHLTEGTRCLLYQTSGQQTGRNAQPRPAVTSFLERPGGTWSSWRPGPDWFGYPRARSSAQPLSDEPSAGG